MEVPRGGPQQGRPTTAPAQDGVPETGQLPMLYLEQLLDIGSTEKIRLFIESQRLAIETRTVAAAEARVVQEPRRLRMDEARIMALVESETHKWTSVPIGAFKDIVMFVLRCGLDDAAAIQSGTTCIHDTHRMRLDSKVDTGQSALYKNPIVTESETLLYVCQITERIIVLGCTVRLGGGAELRTDGQDRSG